MKKILKYVMIFILTLAILLGALVMTAKIPRSAVEENIKESMNAFRTTREIDEVVKRREYTFLHAYADRALLNMIYCVDTQNPLQAVIEAKYYSERQDKIVSGKLDQIVEEQLEGNAQYIRYWHGSMSVIRPLLVFFNLRQIYWLNAVILSALAILLMAMLVKRKQIALAVTFGVGLIMCATIMVPFCLEYTWTFYIMLIVSILAIRMEKEDKKLNILFFVTGMVTCYFDFLTTELITILVPVMIVLVLRYKENRITNFKQGIQFVLQAEALWGISYVAMWLTKWILASIFLKMNAFEWIKQDAMIRVNGQVWGTSSKQLPIKAIVENFFTLYPFNTQKRRIKWIIVPIALFVIEAILIRKKEVKKLWISALLLLIALTPYVRYYILANHSYIHSYFTFRTQFITVMAITLAITYSVDPEIANKQIDLKRRK